MMKAQGLCTDSSCNGWWCPDAGIFLLRLSLAVVFLAHGYGKLTHLDGTIAFFSSIGLPSVFAYLVAVGEFVGGLAMLFGVFTVFFGVVLALIMAGAIYFAKWKLGLMGFEFELVLLFVSLAAALAGPGRYSVAYMMGKKGMQGMACMGKQCTGKKCTGGQCKGMMDGAK